MSNILNFKDRAILLGWIAGLLIIISMIWIFSQPLQTSYLLRSVNSVLTNNGDSRRLSAHINKKSAKTGLMGYWYSITGSQEQMFVFTVFQDGVLIPAGAVVSANGIVNEIIPLSAHAVQVFDAMPQSILQIYIDRIESAAMANMGGN